MKKISAALVLVLSILLLCPTFAQARSSEYFHAYGVTAKAGDERGEIDFTFLVWTEQVVPKFGILKLKIYESDGEYVTTIWGTTSNGLLSPKSGRSYAATYPYKGTPGVSYYAEVTFCAGMLTDYDIREVTTDVVIAPY